MVFSFHIEQSWVCPEEYKHFYFTYESFTKQSTVVKHEWEYNMIKITQNKWVWKSEALAFQILQYYNSFDHKSKSMLDYQTLHTLMLNHTHSLNSYFESFHPVWHTYLLYSISHTSRQSNHPSFHLHKTFPISSMVQTNNPNQLHLQSSSAPSSSFYALLSSPLSPRRQCKCLAAVPQNRQAFLRLLVLRLYTHLHCSHNLYSALLYKHAARNKRVQKDQQSR